MRTYLLAGLVLASWVGNALYCSTIAKRAWKMPVADEEMIVARYNRRGRKQYDIERLRSQIPHLETTVPGLGYTALVPLAIAVTFMLNALVRVLWIQDGTAGVWLSVGLIFLPVALTVYLLSWEQGLQLTRLKELGEGPSGTRVAEMRAKFAEEKAAQAVETPDSEGG